MFLKPQKLVSLATIFALLGAEQAEASFKVVISGLGYNVQYLGGEGDFVGKPTDEGFEMKYDALQPYQQVSARASYSIQNGPYQLGICTISAANDEDNGPRVTVKNTTEGSFACELVTPSGAKAAQDYAFHTATNITYNLIMTGLLGAIPIAMLAQKVIKKNLEEELEDLEFKKGFRTDSLETPLRNIALDQLTDAYIEYLKQPNNVESFYAHEVARLEASFNKSDRIKQHKKNILEVFKDEPPSKDIQYDIIEEDPGHTRLQNYLNASKDKTRRSDFASMVVRKKKKEPGIALEESLQTVEKLEAEFSKHDARIEKIKQDLKSFSEDFFDAREGRISRLEHPHEHWSTRTSVHAFAGIIGLLIAGIPLFAWFGIRGTQAKDLKFDVKLGSVASPVADKQISLVSKLPSGGAALVGGSVALLGGPLANTLLVDQSFENNSSNNLKDSPVFRVLAGKATELPAAYYDEAGAQTLLAIPTSNGLSIVQVDHNAQVKNTPTVLFAGKRVEDVKLVFEDTSKRLVALFNVEEKEKKEGTDEEVTSTKIYALKSDAPSFSPSSREEHFVEFKHAAVDKDNNIYYAFAGEKGLKVLTPKGSSEQMVSDSGLPSTAEVQRVVSLPAGGVLAFTSGGLYHAVPSGQFEPVPASLVSLQADDMMGVILAPKADATDKQVSKVLFYPAQKLEQGKKGALLVTMPIGGTPASWQVEKVFADEYVSSFEEDSSIVQTVQIVESTKEKVVKSYYISPTQVVSERVAISEISDAAYTSEVGSSTLVYALKPKGVLLVDRSSDTERLLAQTSEQTIEKIKVLPNSRRLALIGKLTNTHEPILQVIDKEGRELQTLKFAVGDEISLVSSYPEGAQGDGDILFVSTSDGLLVYKEGLVGSGYKLAYKLFKGTPIDASYVDTDGKLTVYSQVAFSSGFKFNTPFASLSQEIGDEMDGEVLDQD